MKRQIVLFFMIFILISLSVHGASIRVDVQKEQDTVEAGGSALFTITITNKQIREDTFVLEVNDFSVAPFSDAIDNVVFLPRNSITIPTNQEGKVTAKVTFLETARQDRSYIVPLEIRSLTHDNVRETVNPTIFVISPRELVEIDSEINESITPGRENILKFTLRNKGNFRLDNVVLFYTSSVFNFEDTLSLNALEEKEVELNLEVDPLTPEGKYSLSVRVFEGDTLRGSKNFDFFIGMNPDLTEREKVSRGFLSTTVEIVRENNGNTEIERTVKYPIGVFRGLFTKTSPEGNLVVNEEGRFYEWRFGIPPGDIARVEVETDYKWLFFVIVAILLILSFVFYFKKKDVQILKEAFRVGSKDKVTEVKVLLHLKNKTAKDIYNIKILDFLPKFVHSDVNFATLKPTNMQEGPSGRRMIWKVEKLEPGEERVVSYKLKSKLELVGKHDLPGAAVQYFGKKKRLVNVRSKGVSF